MLRYRLMTTRDYKAAYDLWIKCQNGLNNKDDSYEGINKVLLVAFKKNEAGNAFWEAEGFTLRDDLNYRNKALTEMIRIDPEYVK